MTVIQQVMKAIGDANVELPAAIVVTDSQGKSVLHLILSEGHADPTPIRGLKTEDATQIARTRAIVQVSACEGSGADCRVISLEVFTAQADGSTTVDVCPLLKPIRLKDLPESLVIVNPDMSTIVAHQEKANGDNSFLAKAPVLRDANRSFADLVKDIKANADAGRARQERRDAVTIAKAGLAAPAAKSSVPPKTESRVNDNEPVAMDA